LGLREKTVNNIIRGLIPVTGSFLTGNKMINPIGMENSVRK
jgi:hypothetical protein